MDWHLMCKVTWEAYRRSKPQPELTEKVQFAVYSSIASYSGFLASWIRQDSVVNGDVFMLPCEWSRKKDV